MNSLNFDSDKGCCFVDVDWDELGSAIGWKELMDDWECMTCHDQ